MPIDRINGINLYWEQHGAEGPPVVLVHGSWGDHHNWDADVPALSRFFRVFTYDRRGHSQSERLATQGHIEEDVADLAAFIAAQKIAPASVVGNSFGAAVSLKLAASQPQLLASLAIHEPPLMGMIEGDPALPKVQQRIGAVIETILAGKEEEGARLFVETVALGPGMWDKLPPELRQTFVHNAITFVDEIREPGNPMTVDLARLARFDRPVLISRGDQSPPFFGAVLAKISSALPHARHHTFRGAGHVPHLTHAEAFVSVVTDFIRTVSASPPAGS